MLTKVQCGCQLLSWRGWHTNYTFVSIPICSFKPRLSFGGRGREPFTHCLRMCQYSQKSSEFRFFHKISCILNINYPLYYCLFQLFSYLPRLLVSSFMKTARVNYFCLSKEFKAKIWRDKNKDLAINSSLCLGKWSSLFEVLDRYFLVSLFHGSIVVFHKHQQLVSSWRGFILSPYFHHTVSCTCTSQLCTSSNGTWQFHGNFGACADSVYQALFSISQKSSRLSHRVCRYFL